MSVLHIKNRLTRLEAEVSGNGALKVVLVRKGDDEEAMISEANAGRDDRLLVVRFVSATAEPSSLAG